jgi:hypothetical protein
MEGIFHLSPQNALTTTTLEAILAGDLTVKYTPAPPEADRTTLPSGPETRIKPADLWSFAMGLGSEMPTEITRLFLLLQADALVKIGLEMDSVIRRLLDFYQYDIFPQVFNQGLFATPTAHLLQPVFGSGKVYYQGYLLQSADVHDIFSWQPVSWPPGLPAALVKDFSFGLSYAVYTLSQFRKIYRFTETLLPDAVNKDQFLFSDQISLLIGQLDQILAQPPSQALHLNGIGKQLEKLQAKFGEYLAEYLGEHTPAAIDLGPVNEQLPIAPAYLCQLVQTLALDNLFRYESMSGNTYENTREPTLRTLVKPYRLLQQLEQEVALVAISYLTETITPGVKQNIPALLHALYRNQVLNVLKGSSFDELVRKTIAFIYATH